MTVVRMAVRREKVAVRWAWVREGRVAFDRCDGGGKGGQRGDGRGVLDGCGRRFPVAANVRSMPCWRWSYAVVRRF